MKVNGRRNKRGPGGVDSQRVRVHGGTRAEHPEERESRARAMGREQSTPQPPEPQATTRIEQLNTQEMVAYKPADSCVAA